MALTTKLHFHRYEFKYVLGPSLRREVERELGYFMELDPYVAGSPSAAYRVRSLYFDNAMHSHYFDKIDGQLTRAKFRLRTYTRDPNQACAAFLEIKGRHNNLVFKHRSPLEPEPVCHFTAGDPDLVPKILAATRPGKVLDQFRFDLDRKLVEPNMVIDYVRRPLVSKFDPEFRVTFDSELEGQACRTLFPTDDVARKRLMLGKTVMEVKFRFHLPSWFHRIIQSYELDRVSISKICKGIEAFGLAPLLE